MATNNSENSYIKVSSAGYINYPVQPAFSAYLSSSATSVTGDGTAYTVLCDTVLFDQATNYVAGTGIFTAPVAGNYYFSIGATIDTVGVSTNYMLLLVTSTGTYYLAQLNPTVIAVSGVVTICGSAMVVMSATNTAKVQITCLGTTKTVNVSGQATNPLTWFSGILVC